MQENKLLISIIWLSGPVGSQQRRGEGKFCSVCGHSLCPALFLYPSERRHCTQMTHFQFYTCQNSAQTRCKILAARLFRIFAGCGLASVEAYFPLSLPALFQNKTRTPTTTTTTTTHCCAHHLLISTISPPLSMSRHILLMYCLYHLQLASGLTALSRTKTLSNNRHRLNEEVSTSFLLSSHHEAHTQSPL